MSKTPRSLEDDIAKIIFDALHRANPRALMAGTPVVDQWEDTFVLIDGNFDFRQVSRYVVREMRRRNLLTGLSPRSS